MSDDARSFWILAPGRAEVRHTALAEPGADEVQVETDVSGVSAGTERLVFAGRVPPSQHEAMRAPFQQGNFPGPVHYGYAAVGRVVAGSWDLRDRPVFCLHPHASAFVVPRASVVPLPAGVPAGRAVLGANMETALNAVWDAAPLPGERIAVVGAGVVGLLTAHLLARSGHAPLVVDRDPGRAEVAAALGLGFALPASVAASFDLVVHATGAPEGLAWALDLLDFEGRVIELSWYGDRIVPLPLGEAFHARRLTIRSSQVGHVAPAMRGRVDRRARLVRALALLDDARLDALIDAEVALGDLGRLLADLVAGRRSVLCARVHYR